MEAQIRFSEIGQLLKNEWLGRRDSNPDTQIQSSFEAQAAQWNQELSSANCGEVRQNPQCRRNEDADGKKPEERDSAGGNGALEPWTWDVLQRLNLLDLEEETLP